MPMIRALRLLNAVEAQTLTSAQLETLLTSDSGRIGDLRALFNLRGQSYRIANNEFTLAPLCGSGKAFDALLDTTVSYNILLPAMAASTLTAIAISSSDSSFARLLADSAATTSLTPTIVASETACISIASSDSSFALMLGNTATRNGISSTIGTSNTANAAACNSDSRVSSLADSSTTAPITYIVTGVIANSTAMTNLGLRNGTALGKVINTSTFYDLLITSSYYYANLKNICTTLAGLNRDDYAALANVASSSTAMSAITSSASAMKAIAGSSTGLQVFLDSSIARQAILNSSTAMTAVFANTTSAQTFVSSTVTMQEMSAYVTAKLALFNSEIALAAVAANATGRDALRASSSYSVVTTASNTGTTYRDIPVPNSSGTYVILGYSTSDSSTNATITIITPRLGGTKTVSSTGATGSTAALGNIAVAVISPYQVKSADTSTQTFSIGLLRCDV